MSSDTSSTTTNNDNLSQRYNITKTFFDQKGFDELSKLTADERLFAYYMTEAATHCYPVAYHQLCPADNIPIIEKIADYLIENRSFGASANDDFYNQLREYFFYLYSNYGVHSVRETTDNKKTPEDLGLTLLTHKSLNEIVFKNTLTPSQLRYLFDKTSFPTRTVLDDIEQSGGNFYHKFSTESWNRINGDEYLGDKPALNAFYDSGTVKYYGGHAAGVCKNEFKFAIKYIEKALKIARWNDKDFDDHTVKSLEYLIRFLQTGEESIFKEHTKHWLKMNNRVDYCFGLIEYYDDPKSIVGTFQADVSVKSLSLDSLLKLLPSFEKRFPFPSYWKRKDMSILPNAASAYKTFGVGGLGPTLRVIAYCLPNYNDIRSELGSKQIMYTFPKSGDVERFKAIYLSKEEQEFYNMYSPDLTLEDEIHSLTTTLHETIGHASGGSKFTEEERKSQIGSYHNGLEEMRAEILACYTAITFYDEIAECGALKDWPSKIPKNDMIELIIKSFADGGWLRWVGIPKNETKITQAHSRADAAIMHYLIDEGSSRLYKDTIEFEGETLEVLRFSIDNLEKAIEQVGELAYMVQGHSSEPDADLLHTFMERYANSTRDPTYSGIVRKMKEVAGKGVKAHVQVFPEWQPIADVYGKVIDAVPYKPHDPIDAALKMVQKARALQ